MNDKLRSTLDKIQALTKQDSEFARELQKIVKCSSSANSALYSNDKISNIERYLGLDYEIDSSSPEIDYHKINDEYVRKQLINDYREMLRYRNGVRSHKIDFNQFCKYAHFQAEMLINYYLSLKYNDFESCKTAIKVIYPKTKFGDKLSTIEGISYTSKMYFIKKSLKINDNGNYLEYICWARNAVNHRAPSNNQDLENKHSDYLNMIKSSGLPLNEACDDFNWRVINNDTIKKNIYETQYKNKSPFKDNAKAYKYDKFIMSEKFDDVIRTLRDLFNSIINDIDCNNK